VASGFGDPSWNGTYDIVGSYNEQPAYRLASNRWIIFGAGTQRWWMNPDSTMGGFDYYSSSNANIESAWQVADQGTGPAGTVVLAP
jgi:hypothetical protein